MTDPKEDHALITQLVGECIMAWAMVERALTVLYGECVGSPVGPPEFWLHASIFDAVISIDARLDMIETALEFQADMLLKAGLKTTTKWQPILADWIPLRKRVRKKYDKRNEVAHSDITQTRAASGKQVVRLLAFPTLTTGALGGKQKLLDTDQLSERIAAFGDLSGEVMHFQRRVGVTLGRLPESALLPPQIGEAQNEDS